RQVRVPPRTGAALAGTEHEAGADHQRPATDRQHSAAGVRTDSPQGRAVVRPGHGPRRGDAAGRRPQGGGLAALMVWRTNLLRPRGSLAVVLVSICLVFNNLCRTTRWREAPAWTKC